MRILIRWKRCTIKTLIYLRRALYGVLYISSFIRITKYTSLFRNVIRTFRVRRKQNIRRVTPIFRSHAKLIIKFEYNREISLEKYFPEEHRLSRAIVALYKIRVSSFCRDFEKLIDRKGPIIRQQLAITCVCTRERALRTE